MRLLLLWMLKPLIISANAEVESFESFDDFDLLAFDYYDVRSNDTEDSKTLIYLDNRNLFFFCENNAGVKMIKQIVADIVKITATSSFV